MFDGIDAGSWGEIIVGVVAIIVGVYVVVRWQVDKRKLGYQIRTNSIIRVDGVHSDEIEIKFKGTEVRTLTLFSISIKNLGNRPILRTDWEKPVEISFKTAKTKILDVKTASSYPAGLEVSTTIAESEKGLIATVAPILLNAREGFKLQFVVSEFSSAEVKARVIGISDLNNFDEDTSSFKSYVKKNPWTKVAVMLLMLVFVTVDTASTLLSHGKSGTSLLVFLVVTLSFSAFLLWATIASEGEQKLDEKFFEK